MSRRRRDRRLLEVIEASVQPLEPRLLFAQVAWDGGAQDGRWNSPLNWSNDEVPGLNDQVTIGVMGTFTVTLTGVPASVGSLTLGGAAGGGGTQTLVVDSALTLGGQSFVNATGKLRLNDGGTLGGAGALDIVRGRMDWLGGSVLGAAPIRNHGVLHIGGPAAKTLRRTIENLPGNGVPAGTLEWAGGGDVRFHDGAISNRGTMTVTGAGAIRAAGGTNFVYTEAPIDQSGTTVIEVPFDSTGVIFEAITTVRGTLTLAGGGQSRAVFDVSGTLVFAGATYDVLGVGRIRGTGTARFEGGTHRLLSSSGIVPARLEVRGGSTDVEVYDFRVTDLVVDGGATLRVTRGTARVRTLTVGSLSRLDLANAGLIVDYAGAATPLAQVRGLLTSGYAGGAWDGAGISSSAAAAASGGALGYAESARLFASFPATFLNQSVDDTAVLVRPTRYGDADLDVRVDLADFERLAVNFGTHTGDWSDGDFTFERSVTLADFNRLAAQFDAAAGAPGPPPGVPPSLAGDGTLRIEGSDSSDTVGLTLRGTRLRVRVNAELSTFPANDVKRVEIRTRSGSDLVDWSGTAIPTFVDAGDGNDTLTGGAGDDTLHGGNGDNALFGGAGDDQLKAGGGADTLLGESGHDRIRGGAGADLINGGDGKDRVWGQQGNDRVHGRRGDDAIDGGPGLDHLIGDDGNDKLFARDREADALDGGAGNDQAEMDDQVDTTRALERLLA